LLRERSLDSVTMQEVADRAGLSITSVYARFDGKDALVLALHERVIAAGLAALEAALDDGEVAGAPLSPSSSSRGCCTAPNPPAFPSISPRSPSG
jgi:AcrR family transcriptional regulator